jgi:hypothetical protein
VLVVGVEGGGATVGALTCCQIHSPKTTAPVIVTKSIAKCLALDSKEFSIFGFSSPPFYPHTDENFRAVIER